MALPFAAHIGGCLHAPGSRLRRYGEGREVFQHGGDSGFTTVRDEPCLGTAGNLHR